MEQGKDIIEMAIANFEHIQKIANRLTSGNAAHQSRTIAGIASRNIKYLYNYLSEQEQWHPISELKNEMDENKILIKSETEIFELAEKLNKLNDFNASKKANEIDPIPKSLLIVQAGAMYTYLECLKARLVRL